jgi:hypothetical protein
MNLQDQLGALESNLDALLRATPESDSDQVSESVSEGVSGSVSEASQSTHSPDDKPLLHVSRPAQDAIEMAIGGNKVLLSPEGVSELIEELANVRASMTVDQPGGIAPGWRFAATKNPVMATQKYANGDRLLVLRHTGHGWVPFTFTPDMVIEMYAMLTKK